tara:strand:+ start:5822 stop:6049 length:228 start_codon:yes stop_codon:yes gene_type:complete
MVANNNNFRIIREEISMDIFKMIKMTMSNFTTDTATGLPSRDRKGMKVMTNKSKGRGKSAKATKTEDRRVARTSR